VGTDIYAELYLWNKNVDSLIRVLQRLEALHEQLQRDNISGTETVDRHQNQQGVISKFDWPSIVKRGKHSLYIPP